MADAYPLHWPPAWPRTPEAQRERARFTYGRRSEGYRAHGQGAASAAARDNLFHELELLGAANVVLSTNVELRLDGLPHANRRTPEDPGVAVYFTLDGKSQRCIPCDRWDRVADNMHAIALTVAALRGLDRWGTHRIVEAAFSGFKALPERSAVEGRPSWWEELELDPHATHTREDVERAFKRRLPYAHPDAGKGGSTEKLDRLQQARRQALSLARSAS